MRRVLIVASLASVMLFGLVLWKRHQHHAAKLAASHAPAMGIGGIVLPPSRPAYKVHGTIMEVPQLTVVAQLSAQQWSQALRDEVCACKDAACARAVQHDHLREIGTLNFASGDRAETDRYMHETALCTGRLFESEGVH